MGEIRSELEFPLGQRIALPGHFAEPVLLEGVRRLGASYECRVRLPNGAPDETILSADEAYALFAHPSEAPSKAATADPDRLRLLGDAAK